MFSIAADRGPARADAEEVTRRALTTAPIWAAALALAVGHAAAATSAAGRLAAQDAYDARTAAAVQSMLAATMGPGAARAQVSAVLALDSAVRQSIRYDPRQVVTLASSGGRTRYTATGSGGATRATASQAHVVRAAGVAGTTDVSVPGAVVSQSIAIEVPATVPPAALRRIRALVAAAVGYVPGRDVLRVAAVLPVARAAAAAPAAGPGVVARARPLVVPALSALGLLAGIAIVAGMLRRRPEGFGELVAAASRAPGPAVSSGSHPPALTSCAHPGADPRHGRQREVG